MPQRVVSVTNPLGLHARAAARFVKTAARYDAIVTVTRGETTIDGKSILGLLFLAAAQGSRLTIHTSGREAAAALDALTRLVMNGIGDPSSGATPAAVSGGDSTGSGSERRSGPA